ncbi:MAG: hypothetical protein A7316_07155 [Candidatus Altiarchaeales archaeon WOR_SM1_86-2]|nr:MAG: hypothetical protein A7316_07155 [Candidatus Altiarchaeales archaeon WOR_SM1_86-2]
MADKFIILETNVDDCNPEILSYLMEKAMDEGALDIHIIPVIMKKGRAGHLIRVLASESEKEKLAELLMRETATLGVRVIGVKERFEAAREIRKVRIKISGREEEVRVKKSEFGIKAESDDIKRLAKKYNIPYRKVAEKVDGKCKKSICGI